MLLRRLMSRKITHTHLIKPSINRYKLSSLYLMLNSSLVCLRERNKNKHYNQAKVLPADLYIQTHTQGRELQEPNNSSALAAQLTHIHIYIYIYVHTHTYIALSYLFSLLKTPSSSLARSQDMRPGHCAENYAGKKVKNKKRRK